MAYFTDLSTTTDSWIRRLSCSVLFLACLSSPSFAAIKTAELSGNPAVDEDRVTIRIRVKDADDRPIVGLTDNDFKLQVDGKELSFKPKDWKSPQDAVPPPAWIIVLLDMSGSMKSADSRGTTKLAGALQAVKQFNTTIAERAANAPNDRMPQIAIVPFGKPGPNCPGFQVQQAELNKFFPANDFKLQNHLDFLGSQSPCAATNLYEPLSKAIRFLDKPNEPRFAIPQDPQKVQPRLSIILLSDGFHTEAHEAEEFEQLKQLLKRNSQITVHTLGYGLNLKELGSKYKLGRPATRQDIWFGENAQKVPKGKVWAEEFVDQERLKEIAQLTGGISEFSADAEAVSGKLQLFLNALLGEYEISYFQPNADRGSKHDVKAILSSNGANAETEAKPYTISVFGRSLPLPTRLGILLGTMLVMGVGGIAPFWVWANTLKDEDE